MEASQTILIGTPLASVSERLSQSLTQGGYQVTCARNMDEVIEVLAKGETRSLLLDTAWMEHPVALTLERISEATGSLEGGIVALYDPNEPFAFAEARAGGVTQFVALPAPEELVLCQLQTIGAHSDGNELPVCARGMVPLDIFHRQLERAITEARSREKHVAVLCLGFSGMGDAKQGTGAEVAKRSEIEQWLQANMARTVESASEKGHPMSIEMQDLRGTWIRPDRLLMMVPALPRVQEIAKLGASLQVLFQTSTDGPLAPFTSGAALGVALCPGDSTGATGLIDASMRAADRARTEGNTALTFHTESMGLWAFERLTLEDSLHNALRNNEFRVYYQPRVDAQTKEILGVEALVRWVHPQLGMVSPGQFIPLAEETGLIVSIGEWVLREACRQNQAWREAGYKPIRVSVNLSPVQFRDACLTDLVDSALSESGLATDGLELEVTESMLMNDPDETISTLKQLKSRGLKISIDDFGTGYSSLSYLKQFPIDSLKVDRSFIRDVTTNTDDAAITTAVILMGHSLKLNVVAEGVETESQLAFLQVLQCNEIQGFLFSPPVPADKLEAMLPKVGERQLR